MDTLIAAGRQSSNSMNLARSITVVTRSGLALALELASCSPAQLGAAESLNEKDLTESTMMEHCAEMKAQKQKMNDDIKLQSTDLADKMATMNEVPADQKLTLLAAIVTKMAEQKSIMDERKANMEEQLMTHIMQHLSMNKGTMAKCPMMTAAVAASASASASATASVTGVTDQKSPGDHIGNDHNEPRAAERGNP